MLFNLPFVLLCMESHSLCEGMPEGAFLLLGEIGSWAWEKVVRTT